MTQIELASEAMRTSIGSYRMAAPALSGCPRCGTVRMIAGPTLDSCEGCGGDLSVVAPQQTVSRDLADQVGAKWRRDAA